MCQLVCAIGSLLKLETLSVPHMIAKRASLNGFRRDWGRPFNVKGNNYLALALVADKSSKNLGVMNVKFSYENLPYIYERETWYSYILVNTTDEYGNKDLAISFAADPVEKGYIPLSYLTTCAEGFADHYGSDGIEEFLHTTEFGQRIIIDDRESPVYSRTNVEDPRSFDIVLFHLNKTQEIRSALVA